MFDPGATVAAGWRLEIARRTLKRGAPATDESLLVLTNEMLNAEIRTASQRGLNGGMTEVKISGLPRPVIEQLLSSGAPKEDAVLVGKLQLHWRGKVPLPGLDILMSALQSATAPTPDNDTLAAVFAITRMVPEVEQVRYALTLSGPNAIFHALSTRNLDKQLHAKDGPELAAAIVKELGGVPKGAPAVPTPSPVPGVAAADPRGGQSGTGERGSEALERVGDRVAKVAGLGTLLPYLLRGDRILVGQDVLTVFTNPPRELAPGSGIISAAPRSLGSGEGASGYTLTLRGDPKLKPGDVVKFAPPVPKGGLPGTGLALADNVMAVVESITGEKAGDAVLMLIDSVSHSYQARSGFITELVGVVVANNRLPPQPSQMPAPRIAAASATGESAAAIQSKLGGLAGRASLDIGEVRSFAPGPSPPAPGQSSTVIYGLASRGENNNALRQVDVDRKAANRMGGVAYLTPFAWGPFGQVLPRYPGTRVLLGSHGGVSDDSIDLGALWWAGEGNENPGPPDVEPGDHWLLLPIKPEKIPGDGADAISPRADGASHDLTDTDGRRVLQLAGLTVRVGAVATGGAHMARPVASEEAVAIEVETDSGTARVTIKPNGDIEIEAGGKLKLSTGSSIEVEASDGISISSSKDIKLTASDGIELSVGGTSLKVGSSQVEIE